MGLLLAACSGSRVDREEIVERQNSDFEKKEKASAHFLEGAVYDLKSKYAEAILEYQQALKYDTSAGIFYAIGKNYYRLGKLLPALENSRKAVELMPGNKDFNLLLATVYKAGSQPDSAAAVFKRLVEADSNNADAMYNLALLLEDDKPSRAIEIYKKLIEMNGPDWTILARMAELNERMGNIDETISIVEKLLELNPSDMRMQKLLIQSWIDNEKYDDALKLTEELLPLFPNDAELIELKAGSLIQKGDGIGGLKQYSKIVEMDNVDFISKKRIATLYFNKALNDTSILDQTVEMIKTVNADSSDWQLNAFLGELSLRQKKDSLALEYFRFAAGDARWNSDLQVRLGGMLFDNEKYAETIELMDNALENFPDEFAMNLLMGLSLGQENRHEEAVGYLEKAVRLNPGNFTALYAYGFSLNQMKRYEEAIESISKALEIDPENAPLLGTLGLIYDDLEQWDKCDSVYQKALSIDPESALVLNNYAYSLSERGIRLEEAKEMVEKALEKDPESSSYLDTMGWIYYRLGEYNKAEEFILRSLKYDEDNAEVLDHLGDVYFEMGDKEKARRQWEKALEIDPALEKIKIKLENK